MEQIKIELCGGKMPEKAHATDAAFDVFTREDVELVPYLRTAIPLGFKIQLPTHLAAVIQPRSGMSLKGMTCKVRTENGSIDARIDADVLVGLVDCGSTPELCSRGKHGVFIPAGTKIAQMRIVQVPSVTLEIGTIDKDTERGEHGFNSTGIY